MPPRRPDATPAISKPPTKVGKAPKRAINSEPGSAAMANRMSGRPERIPISVPDSLRSAWINGMTGGTARMVSRSPTPASQSRLAAAQNSRMDAPGCGFR